MAIVFPLSCEWLMVIALNCEDVERGVENASQSASVDFA